MVCKNFDYVFSVLYSSLRNKLGKNLEKNILYVWICFLCFIVRYFFYMCLFENRSDKNIWFYLLCFAGQIFYWSLSHTSCHNWWEIWHLSGEQWVNSWKDLNMILVLEQVWSNKILYILCGIISQEPEPKSKYDFALMKGNPQNVRLTNLLQWATVVDNWPVSTSSWKIAKCFTCPLTKFL